MHGLRRGACQSVPPDRPSHSSDAALLERPQRQSCPSGEAGARSRARFLTTEGGRRATVGHRSRSGSPDSRHTAWRRIPSARRHSPSSRLRRLASRIHAADLAGSLDSCLRRNDPGRVKPLASRYGYRKHDPTPALNTAPTPVAHRGSPRFLRGKKQPIATVVGAPQRRRREEVGGMSAPHRFGHLEVVPGPDAGFAPEAAAGDAGFAGAGVAVGDGDRGGVGPLITSKSKLARTIVASSMSEAASCRDARSSGMVRKHESRLDRGGFGKLQRVRDPRPPVCTSGTKIARWESFGPCVGYSGSDDPAQAAPDHAELDHGGAGRGQLGRSSGSGGVQCCMWSCTERTPGVASAATIRACRSASESK